MNFELLRDIAAAVDGIPDELFDLNQYGYGYGYVYECGQSLPCDTIGCVAGHMYKHPTLGFDSPNPERWRTKVASEVSQDSEWTYKWSEVNHLFNSCSSEEGHPLYSRGAAGKVTFAKRVVKFLRKYNQPVSEEYLDNIRHMVGG